MKKTIYVFAAMLISLFAASMSMANASEVSETMTATKVLKTYHTVEFNINLHCKDCEKKVRENIAFEKGVKALAVSLEGQLISITYDPDKTDEKKLEKAIKKLGYKVTKREVADAEKK